MHDDRGIDRRRGEIMARDDRKQQILGMLEDRGSVEVEALAQQFSVSKMTIHRDLDDLESEGVLRKIRGGATIEAFAISQATSRCVPTPRIGSRCWPTRSAAATKLTTSRCGRALC